MSFLVYDPLQEQGFSELEKARFVAEFTHASIEVTAIPATAEEIKNGSVDAHVRRIHKKYHYNAIVTLRDPLIMSLMEVLSHSAEDYQVPLYSADPESVLTFAAIASGYKGYDMGSQFATTSLPKLKERRRPLLIPTTLYSLDYKSYANRTIMQRQGLEITDENREWFMHHVSYTSLL